MGLDLRRKGILTAEALEDLPDFEAMSKEIDDFLYKKMGVGHRPPPEEPQPIDDLSVDDLTDRELGALHMAYTRYGTYLAREKALLESKEKYIQVTRTHLAAKVKIDLRASGIKPTEIAEHLEVHPQYYQLTLQLVYVQTQKERLDAYRKEYDKIASSLSRNVEARKAELERSTREHTIQKDRGQGRKGKGPPPKRTRKFGGPRFRDEDG